MNYAELVADIKQYVENYEATFVSSIPRFVDNAEKRIFHAVQLPANRLNKTTTVVISNQYITLPTDFLHPYSLSVAPSLGGAQTFLMQRDVNYLREAYPDPSVEGVPKHYAIFDTDTLIVAPTPDAGYTVELHYGAYPESIVTAGTTWIGDNFPHVLLYGSLVEAYTFVKGEEALLKHYDTQFKEGLLMLKQFGDGKLRKDGYRSGQLRLPEA